MIKNFIFDIGNVVWRYQLLLDRFKQQAAQLNHYTFVHFCSIYDQHYKSLEDNHLTLEQFVKLLPVKDVAPYLRILDSVYHTPEFESFYNPEVVDLVARLRRHFTVAYLSNAENYLYPYIQQKIIGIFSFGYCSWQLGLRKPDPAIYQQLLSRHSLAASETIFIDDRPANIHGAQALGIHGIIFENYNKLILDLESISPSILQGRG